MKKEKENHFFLKKRVQIYKKPKDETESPPAVVMVVIY